MKHMAEPTQGKSESATGLHGAARLSNGGLACRQLAARSEQMSREEARRRVGHDIRHELSTIMLLASVLSEAPDLGGESRQRAHQLLVEARWLDELLRAYEGALSDPPPDHGKRGAPIRADAIAIDVVAPIKLAMDTRLIVEARPAWVCVDRLALWRALRNIIVNALEAAGEKGTVVVRVDDVDGQVIIDVKDDGPGFDEEAVSATSLGLSIALDLVESWGGELRIRRNELGGCGVRMMLPSAYADRRTVDVVGA
jgi:two-component system sporulation sensor kinase A